MDRSQRSAPFLLIQARVEARTRPINLGVIREHDFMTRLAQLWTVVAQAGDDPVDIRNIAAAQPEHVRPTCISLRHRTLGQSRAAARREDNRYDDHLPDRNPIHIFSPSTMKNAGDARERVSDFLKHQS
jgi:hypothetical protein